MTDMKFSFKVIMATCCIWFFAGCERDPLDPTQIGRFRPTPVVNIILDSLGVAEETDPIYEAAQQPAPVDLIAFETDYALQAGDIITISIFELLQERETFIQNFVITESGQISIPEVGNIQAAGLSETELEEEIKQILSPTILRDPTVTVILQQSESRAFTILGGGVPRPERYPLPRYEFRLADALARAGSPAQFNVSYIYVTRNEKFDLMARERYKQMQGTPTNVEGLFENGQTRQTPQPQPEYENGQFQLQPVEPKKQENDEQFRDEMLEVIAPHSAKSNRPTKKPVSVDPKSLRRQQAIITAVETSTQKELKALAAPHELEDIAQKEFEQARIERIEAESAVREFERREQKFQTQPEKTLDEPEIEQQQPASRIEWVFEDGRWKPIQIFEDDSQQTQPQPEQQWTQQTEPAEPADKQQAQWPDLMSPELQRRVIRIPVDKFLGGDPRYNIVIRPGDTINVPFDVVGEAVVMGNVNSQGYVDITGRPMTLMQAIAAAGGLGPLAEPTRVEVRRRVGDKREQIVMVDLDKIARGIQPDFFIKEHDTINVGTLWSSRYAAVLRNAFRATYGFGFIYDRNYADRDFGTRRPIPDIF